MASCTSLEFDDGDAAEALSSLGTPSRTSAHHWPHRNDHSTTLLANTTGNDNAAVYPSSINTQQQHYLQPHYQPHQFPPSEQQHFQLAQESTFASNNFSTGFPNSAVDHAGVEVTIN